MGAAASSLPEDLSEEDLRRICGEKFDGTVFASLKDPSTNMVKRDQFLAAVTAGEEKEVMQLYLSFSSNGEMDSRTFIKLLKDSKSLNKTFSTTDADLIFTKCKNKISSTTKTINFNIFRTVAIPLIAEKKGISESDFVSKLSRCEGPALHGTTQTDAVRFHDDKSTFTGAHAKNEKNKIEEANEEQHTAALKLQSVQRQKQAKQTVETLKEIKNSEFREDQVGNIAHDDDCEQAVAKLFLSFNPEGEMDSRTFIKMMRDTGTVRKKFTSGDADLVFQKTKAMASQPTAGSYSAGVVHGKRVKYEVFRAIAVPAIAEKLGMSVGDYVKFLAEASGPVLNGVTSTDNVRFHDDKSTYTGVKAN